MDASAVKRMLLSFEKKVLKNQEMRIKFPDMPEKFMESELELNDEIQTLHVIATVPEYYPILVETNTVQTLMGLLSHDNSDVAIAVIDLLQEMTDVDTVNESEEEAEKLIEAMLEEQVDLLVVDVKGLFFRGWGGSEWGEKGKGREREGGRGGGGEREREREREREEKEWGKEII